MQSGILVVLKPTQMTSHDVIGFLRRKLGIKRIGHTGTLDPDATGVLPVCIGSATRVAEYLTEHGKTYRAEMTLGIKTDTQDASGRVVGRCEVFSFPMAQLEEALQRFRGPIDQIPPMTSAISVNGRRLYELARQGIEVPREARRVEIRRLEIVNCPPLLTMGSRVLLDMECSKGTYVRTLCHDVGEQLGVGAHMSFLLRTRSGPFGIDDAHTLEEIALAAGEGRIAELMKPIRDALQSMPQVMVADEQLPQLRNGMTIPVDGTSHLSEAGPVLVLDLNGNGIAIAEALVRPRGCWLKPHKVFA